MFYVASVDFVDVIGDAYIAGDTIDIVRLLHDHHFGGLLDLIYWIVSISCSLSSQLVQAIDFQLLHLILTHQSPIHISY